MSLPLSLLSFHLCSFDLRKRVIACSEITLLSLARTVPFPSPYASLSDQDGERVQRSSSPLVFTVRRA